MYQYGTTREHLAAVAVKNHANGAKNPLAHMRKVITMEQALNGKPISEPLYGLRLFAHQRRRRRGVAYAVRARVASLPISLCACSAWPRPPTSWHSIKKPTSPRFRAVRRAAEKAYKMAGVTPRDIQFAEVHDCFTIAEIIAIEDLGFVEKG